MDLCVHIICVYIYIFVIIFICINKFKVPLTCPTAHARESQGLVLSSGGAEQGGSGLSDSFSRKAAG